LKALEEEKKIIKLKPVKEKLNIDTVFNQAEIDKKDYFNPIFNQKQNTSTGVKRKDFLYFLF
jgi:hypothetical protein